jgi:transposase
MKCVCPMGGNRTCPDNCLIAVWYRMPEDQRTKERRRPIVETLRKQGYTQEAIAMQLGVSQKTISNDIETLVTVTNVKGQGKDTLGRKRSTGRPQGSKAPRQSTRGRDTPKLDQAREIVRTKLEANQPISPHKLQDQHGGISHVTFDMAITAELARKEAIEEKTALDTSLLSKTAQEKLDAAIRAHQRKLDLGFEQRVRDEIKKRIDEMVLPAWKQQIEQAKELYSKRRALMDKELFNTIRRALHPDSRNSISDKKLGEAFDAFMSLEKYLINEKDSPTKFEYPDGSGLPDNLAEWDRMRAAAASARKKRPNASALRPR